MEANAGDVPTSIEDAITSRFSARGFLPTEVPDATIRQILEIAARAPSGTNMQPWQVHVLTGATKQRLTDAIMQVRQSQPDGHEREYKYYPDKFFDPYLARRRKVGWDLYGLLGIAKGDKSKMFAQHSRNFAFFDAPVGMIFTIDRRLEIGSWLDYGMFLQNIMIAARAKGLHSCPQAAFATYHKVIRAELLLAESDVVVCGLALGYVDWSAPANQLKTERAPLEEFAQFYEG